MDYRIIIINEEDEELVRNEAVIDSDEIEQIEKILDEGVIETYDECESVCDVVTKMLNEVGEDGTSDHDTIISILEEYKLVKKEE